MAAAPLELANDFWRFSLSVYAAAGVADECLALQDEFDVDVNLLLFCAWAGTKRDALTRADIADADAVVATWRNDVVRPLRAARRALKRIEGDIGFSAKVKATELEAEQVEQALLHRHARARGSESRATAGADMVVENVRAYLRMVANNRVASGEIALPEKLTGAARAFVR